ncbi:MAG TPA: hypothetical protein VNB49_10615 [Candidatus Dormibacteraeota bacterium]|nr:hypothetical protein [Candidatus Dormibacteraeota bacterium]
MPSLFSSGWSRVDPVHSLTRLNDTSPVFSPLALLAIQLTNRLPKEFVSVLF